MGIVNGTPMPVGFKQEEGNDMPSIPFNPGMDIKDTIIINLQNQIKDKDARIKELTDILLSQAGFLEKDRKVEIPESLKPIKPPKERWDAVAKRLTARNQKTLNELVEKASSSVENLSLELEEL